MDNLIHFTQFDSSEIVRDLCRKHQGQCVIITDDNVGPLYGPRLTHFLEQQNRSIQTITIPAGENSKTRETKAWIEDEMQQLNCGRDTVIFALGGGVVTDLAGFVAATFCRGVPVIYIPTSLMAMVDAAIGGKTGVNTRFGKNLIGTFTLPHAILIDTSLLLTLPENEYRLAFAEIIKHALIADETLLSMLEMNVQLIAERDPKLLLHIIERSCQIKSNVVAMDVTEQGKREILNFGHTIAHALEQASHYQIQHGQAVAIGLVVEAHLANQLKLLAKAECDRIHALITHMGIPLQVAANFTKLDVFNAIGLDKKTRAMQSRCVLLKKIGEVFVENNQFAHPISEKDLQQTIDYLFNLIASAS